MATANDWDTRKVRLQDQFQSQLPSLITNYEQKTRSLGDLVTQVVKLEDEKGTLEHEIARAELASATADREFLERKQTMADPFVPAKVYTIQDITFLLFFISYCIFIIALAMISESSMSTFMWGLVGLLIIVMLLYRYI